MTTYRSAVGPTTHTFDGLVDLLAKATARRSGDELAGCAAGSDTERADAQWAGSPASMDLSQHAETGYDLD